MFDQIPFELALSIVSLLQLADLVSMLRVSSGCGALCRLIFARLHDNVIYDASRHTMDTVLGNVRFTNFIDPCLPLTIICAKDAVCRWGSTIMRPTMIPLLKTGTLTMDICSQINARALEFVELNICHTFRVNAGFESTTVDEWHFPFHVTWLGLRRFYHAENHTMTFRLGAPFKELVFRGVELRKRRGGLCSVLPTYSLSVVYADGTEGEVLVKDGARHKPATPLGLRWRIV